MEFKHIPVLLDEVITGLEIKSNGIYVDGTLGGAGHSGEICKRIYPEGRLIGIDQDKDAIEAAKIKLPQYENIITFVNDNFVNMDFILNNLNIDFVDGILMDLGVSSYQLDTPERGFSYNHDFKLDMRMNIDSRFSAYEVVNSYTKEQLKKIIREYGEENWADRIAEFIVESRKQKPITTTFELVDVIKRAVPKGARKDGPHPAKRTFQAIRIEVNNELGIIEKAIIDSVKHLKPGGRLCIITFHSLEDRIVKNTFKKLSDPCECPKSFPQCVCGKVKQANIITRKPVLPSENELIINSRARSAKLRILEKVSDN